MRSKQYIYVGSLLQVFGERRTGIPRVEWEIARRLIGQGAIPFAFDERINRFCGLADGVLDIAQRVQDIELEPLMDAPPSRSGYGLSRAIARAAATAYPRMPHQLGIHWHTERLALHYFTRAFDAMSAAERHDFTRRLGVAPGSGLEGKMLERLARRADGSRVIHWRTSTPIDFEPGSVIVNCGIWWAQSALTQMRQLKVERQVRYVGLIHDLSPIVRPEDFVSGTFCSDFKRYLDAALGFGDRLLPISRHVARHLESYAVEAGLPVPAIEPLRLAPGIVPGGTAKASSRLIAAGLRPGSFVPLISTLNARKGHRFSFELWRRVVDELGDKAPTLVWAGQRSRPDTGVLEVAAADRRLWGRHLHFIEGPSDAEVAWLYSNAAYTIYPSSFEGWGLPVSESLAFGKYCLTADNTSLPEAGEGLAFHATAGDVEPWLAEIRRLALEPGYLSAQTARVQAGYKLRTWDDVANDISAATAAVSA